MLIDRSVVGGVALGVILTVGTIVGATAFSQQEPESSALSTPAGSRTLLTGTDALALGCRPDEAAVVQPFTFQGERGLNSQCVVVTAPWAAASSPAQLVESSDRVAAMTVRSPARTSVAPATSRTRQNEPSSGRTWKKTALVIGGSTAAGAGIGGLIGGKKGALIGSAIGGGSSTIYEATKRR
jgi:hypothetical protein